MPTAANKKRKYNYIWISLVILVFGIIFIPKIVDRLAQGDVVRDERSAPTLSSGELAYIENGATGERRKVPPFSFLNQDSVLVTDKDYLGKVYVVEFFFTTCPTICPVMTKNLVELQNTFAYTEDFGVASFTINPRYDTPTVLKKYAEKNGITDPDWHLLTGDQDEIYRLAEEGFYIVANEVEDAPGGFEHSGMFALVDKEGYIRSRKDGFGNPLIYYRGTITQEQGTNAEGEEEQISLLKEDIKKLLKE
ncbi:SCO family protein [Flagellimonas lutaonensis]|uniref:Electron transport protein SCO1/SenC n=1 Tax=Flagellimonas lutaonensis TaxID=516051 RepID=A0A0D5YTI8_9FLAO|nr:SCO family protein [Allomuricauda lutaonensis]AKA35555.1 Electron transport protein SCO1/SenC [Allomuricauda lutaonensis]